MKEQGSKAERTRNFIIESTAEIFNKKGYAGTSLSDLTEATGLTKGSIYGNFENKEDVALAVFDYNHSRITQRTRALVDQAETYHDKLMVYATVYKRLTRDRESLSRGGCPILNTAIEADDTNEPLKGRASKAILGWKRNLVLIIEGGISAGEFKKDTQASQVAVSMIALIEGGLMISRVTEDPKSMDQVLKTIESLISQIKT